MNDGEAAAYAVDHVVYKDKALSSTVTSGLADECTICLEEFEHMDRLHKLRCCHRFHPACIQRWLSLHPTCPTCRARAV